MEQYVSKYAIVAEIERRETNIKEYCFREGHDTRFDVVPEQLSQILSFINTLETKEIGNNLWKSANGDDFPEIDREVIALIEAFGHYEVIFAHRVDENAEIHTSIDGKPLVLHPKKHGKGGWNIPDVKFWLDCELPKMEE